MLSHSVMPDSLQPYGLLLLCPWFQKEYWNGLPFPLSGYLPDPEIEPLYLASPALAGRFSTIELPGKPVVIYILDLLNRKYSDQVK